MALSALSGDEQGILFVQLCNVLDPGIAVALSSVSNELRTATRAPLQQLKTGHEAAAALCRKLGHRNCKALREAKEVRWYSKGLTADELALLGTLGIEGSLGIIRNLACTALIGLSEVLKSLNELTLLFFQLSQLLL